MIHCYDTRSAFAGIAYDDDDVCFWIQQDIERCNTAKRIKQDNAVNRTPVRNTWADTMLACPNLFPKDHFLKREGGAPAHIQRWFISPFDFHTNEEIDRIIELAW